MTQVRVESGSGETISPRDGPNSNRGALWEPGSPINPALLSHNSAASCLIELRSALFWVRLPLAFTERALTSAVAAVEDPQKVLSGELWPC